MCEIRKSQMSKMSKIKINESPLNNTDCKDNHYCNTIVTLCNTTVTLL